MKIGNLMLTLKLGHSVQIGDAVVTFLRLDEWNGEPRVVLGIEAPVDIAVLRDDAKRKVAS